METVRISAQMVRQMSLICYNTTQGIIIHLRQTQVNTDKTKVVHFEKGPKIRACTIFNFKLGKNHTEIVNTSLAPNPFFIFLFFLFLLFFWGDTTLV